MVDFNANFTCFSQGWAQSLLSIKLMLITSLVVLNVQLVLLRVLYCIYVFRRQSRLVHLLINCYQFNMRRLFNDQFLLWLQCFLSELLLHSVVFEDGLKSVKIAEAFMYSPKAVSLWWWCQGWRGGIQAHTVPPRPQVPSVPLRGIDGCPIPSGNEL